MRFVSLLALSLCLAGTALAAEVDAPAIWDKKCSSCHGKTGDAQTKMGLKHKIEDMSTAAWQGEAKHTDAFIKDTITNGTKDADGKPTKMAAFKEKLKAGEIDALVKHVRSLKK